MTPEASRFLQNAENHLESGHTMLGVHLNDDAARGAYLAAFHAAQAVIFERSGRVGKTHRGVQNEFLLLTKDDPLFTPDQRIFLSQAYNFKAVADYETGPAELQQNKQPPSPANKRVDCVIFNDKWRGFFTAMWRSSLWP